jgi:predicted nucleic acid-binding Zn ribbon protein
MPIGEATRRLLRARGLDATVTLAEVLVAWDDIVGLQVAGHARPAALHAMTLTVEVDEPAWATQLQFLSGSLLAGLAERLGDHAPSSLSIRVARPGSGRTRAVN